jgi:hypothetical protein
MIAQALPWRIENETSLSTSTVSSPLLKVLRKCSTLKMTGVSIGHLAGARDQASGTGGEF